MALMASSFYLCEKNLFSREEVCRNSRLISVANLAVISTELQHRGTFSNLMAEEIAPLKSKTGI